MQIDAELLKDWLGTHQDSVIDLKRALNSLEPLRGLDFSKTQKLAIAPNPPNIAVMESV